jgi:hypothetical protein
VEAPVLSFFISFFECEQSFFLKLQVQVSKVTKKNLKMRTLILSACVSALAELVK